VDELKLPEQLDGPWDHVLILTYGADIPFFENALWGQLKTRCRNKIVLADGHRYLEACATYARTGLVRHLNQRYVAEGIFAPRAAHAKLILLTNAERGRLLVGSGNLGWQGYASGGELFTQYEYSPDDPQTLNAFLAVHELVEGLVAHQYVGPPVVKRIRYLWEKTPWLYQSPVGTWRPVRHNLSHSFLSQLQQACGDEPIEELWVLSPFYDQEALALERMIAALNPRQITLLMQPGYTSVDPTALQQVFARCGSRCRVRSFGSGSESPYVHAKMYLLKMPDRSICLQGSPNLSQVAMLWTVPQGNVELANLFSGPRDAFDELLAVLNIQTTDEPLDSLDLSYQLAETALEQTFEQWRLTGGEWHRNRMSLRFQGTMPDLREASLLIADRAFPIDVCRGQHQSLEVKLSTDAANLLGRPVPVAVRWSEGDDERTTNPVFVCNNTVLDAILEIVDDGDTLPRIGDLDLDDEEFERLLAELDAALVFDRPGVWILAGKTSPRTTNGDDEALRLDYADVDYDMLRQHPKLRQYARRRSGEPGYARSRLQIILNAITDHFRGLLDGASDAKPIEKALAELEDSQAETEEEREQEEEERQRRRQSYAKRLRRILMNFVRRYLRGLQSPDFQELAGPEVMAQNYVIFSHLLWRLFARDWVEPEFIVKSLHQMWTMFWGCDPQSGYFGTLDENEKAQVLELVQGEQHADAVLLASLYYAARLTLTEHWQELRLALRDFWRQMLLCTPFELSARVLNPTWHTVAELFPYEPPLPETIVEELTHLAQFETQRGFLRAVENEHGYPRGSCRFEKVKVRRAHFDDAVTATCLVIGAKRTLATRQVALAMLRDWMRFEDLEYYRIASPDCHGSQWMLFYEVSESVGVYWVRDRGDPIDIEGSVIPRSADWDAPLSELMALAGRIQAELVLAVDEVLHV
jgi:hypothetical protein